MPFVRVTFNSCASPSIRARHLQFVQVQVGSVWANVGQLNVGVVSAAKETGNTGVIANDWISVEDSATESAQDIQIDTSEVRAVVGGTAPIVIDPNANS